MENNTPSPEWEGKRIRLIEMKDHSPVAPGTTGTIRKVDNNVGVIEVDWDSDRTLAIIPELDRFEFI
jgi:hypothetical protein